MGFVWAETSLTNRGNAEQCQEMRQSIPLLQTHKTWPNHRPAVDSEF